MVLAVGYLGVALIGYPDKLQPPNRVSSYEWVNLPVRWDAGLVPRHRPERLRLRPQRAADGAAERGLLPGVSDGDAGGDGVAGRPHHAARRAGCPATAIEWQYAMHRRALAAGLLVSIGAFGWGLVYLFRLVRALGGDETAAASAVVLACAWPCALFYSAVYTEGLFFLGVVGAWYHLRERAVGGRLRLGPRHRAVAPERIPRQRAARAAGRRRLARHLARATRRRAGRRCSASRRRPGPASAC